jgi:hypothetical protein
VALSVQAIVPWTRLTLESLECVWQVWRWVWCLHYQLMEWCCLWILSPQTIVLSWAELGKCTETFRPHSPSPRPHTDFSINKWVCSWEMETSVLPDRWEGFNEKASEWQVDSADGAAEERHRTPKGWGEGSCLENPKHFEWAKCSWRAESGDNAGNLGWGQIEGSGGHISHLDFTSWDQWAFEQLQGGADWMWLEFKRDGRVKLGWQGTTRM